MSQSNDPWKKAITNILELYGDDTIKEWVACLDRVKNVPNARQVYAHIASARDKETIEDYLAEIHYALIFNSLGFGISFEPKGAKGPDLEIARDGNCALVEVKRIRDINTWVEEVSIHDNDPRLLPELKEDTLKAIKKIYDKVVDSLDQLGDNTSIVAIWNNEGVDDINVEQAFNDINDDMMNGKTSHSNKLQFGLFGSLTYYPRPDKRFFCFQASEPLESPFNSWIKDIEGFR
ncbi:MAG: hypothetical protein JW854_16075 [Actinobacteria bacterium]|nr:hypothetical protein [Actinomycetota bacterium]